MARTPAALLGGVLAANVDGPAFHGDGAGPPPRTPLPLAGAPLESVLEEYRELVLTRSLVPTSGRFFGYVPGARCRAPPSRDYLAALTNPYASVYGASPGATQIENSAVAWLIEMIGYPEGAWGTLQSGGSHRHAHRGRRRARGPAHADRARGVVYMTGECHLAVCKALHIAGLGHTARAHRGGGRAAPHVGRRSGCPDRRDRKQGLLPWLVFASAAR
jgi:glutamate/tyrosine decarboxylase-like PLP-dependent enzyme